MMNKLTLGVLLLASTIAQGQEKQRLVGLPDNGKNESWIELHIPITKNGGFEDAVQESDTDGIGMGVTLGWQPFKTAVDDPKIVKILKKIGFDVGLNFLNRPKFDRLLYSYEIPLTYNEASMYCYNQEGYLTGACFRCYSASGFCQLQNVYGRDTYVKYSSGSIAIGAYVPLTVAKRIVFQAGANVRFHFIQEGIQTDRLDSSLERSYGAVLKVTYLFTNRFGVTAGYEKSFAGFKYNSWTFGVTYRF